MRTKIVIEKISLDELYECLESNIKIVDSLKNANNKSALNKYRLEKSEERVNMLKERIAFANNNKKDYVLICDNKILRYFDINDMKLEDKQWKNN